MHFLKKILMIPFLIWGFFSLTNAYLFWFKSFDNTVENIIQIEQKYQIFFPIVSFIYDPREENNVPAKLKEIQEKLWTQRVYHLTISPNQFSAEQVANGAFDEQYLTFFALIKELDLKVIFRTMHEMNGGRYPRSSNPENFKKAWIHVRELSRRVDLDQSNILFDMSINARDLPAKNWIPSQTTTFIECQPKLKKKLKCASFEDYYPGDKYVDIMGFTFYNRGKGNSTRRRGNPDKIINNENRQTLTRIKTFQKPLFVDEVGTTAVNYPGEYDYHKSLHFYETRSDLKNQRILQLQDFLQRESQILGAIYFNVDLTNGLQHQIIWELDRALINLQKNKFYESFWNIYNNSNRNLENILKLFGLEKYTINAQPHMIPSDILIEIKRIERITTPKLQSWTNRAELYQKLAQTPHTTLAFKKALTILSKAYLWKTQILSENTSNIAPTLSTPPISTLQNTWTQLLSWIISY